MTREEAIYYLGKVEYLDANEEQAIDMAIEALQREEAEAKGYCHRIKPKEYFSADAEQVTSKLNNPCNSLLTDESNGSKEHKSKLYLISIQDVIEALCRSSVYAWSIEQDQTAHDWALNIIKALPSADAELVRCKDCDRGFGSPVCPIQSKGWAINTDAFYCAWGERKEP